MFFEHRMPRKLKREEGENPHKKMKKRQLSILLAILVCVSMHVAPAMARHECIHSRVKDLPGYGASKEIIDLPYALDLDDAATLHQHRRAFHAEGNSAYEPLRVKFFFDSGD